MPADNLLGIQQYSHCRLSLLQSVRSYLFLARPTFMPTDMHNVVIVSCQSEKWVECLSFSSSFIFFLFTFSFQLFFQLWRLSQLPQRSVPLWFPLSDVVITTDTAPSHWAFYFHDSGLPLSFKGIWSCSVHKVCIVLKNVRQLHFYGVEWSFIYLIRWLP